MTTSTVDGGDWLSTLTQAPSPRVRRSPQNKTTGDYLGAIRQIKAYLDGYWSGSANCFEIPSDWPNTTTISDGSAWRAYCRDSRGNAYWLATVAILANYDSVHGTSVVSSTDKSRAVTLANQFAGTTGSVYNASWGTWRHQMDGVDVAHEAIDSSIALGLYWAYKYRSAIGWTVGTGPADALNKLTVDRTTTIYYGRTLSLNTTTADNQDHAYWQWVRMCIAHLLGSTPADLDNCLPQFADNFAATTPYSVLFGDFSWPYGVPAWPYPSWEYSGMSTGGALLFYPDVATAANLTSGQKTKLKAWVRSALGTWGVTGYPNWHTVWSNARQHSMSYWMWAALGLLGIARNDGYLNQNAGDGAIAKGILDNLIDTWRALDTFDGDARDGAVPIMPMGDELATWYAAGSDLTCDFAKHPFAARLMLILAMAVEFSVSDMVGNHSPNLWTWHWQKQTCFVSTPNYSTAVVPYAPPINTTYGGSFSGSNTPDAVQLQHWGPSHVQHPNGRWMTALGGYGAGHAFVAQVIRNGSTELDTSATSPTSRDVYCDGSQINASKTDYSTTAIPTTFATSLRHVCSGAGANYSLTADTTFYADRFETTYTVTKTGTAGTVSLNLEIPTRSGAAIKAHDGAALTDITSSGTVSTPVYAHQTHGSYGIAWKVSGLSGFTSIAQSKATSSAVYEREVDRGRSIQLTLSAGTLSTSASVKVTGYVTNGTDQQANHFAGIS